MDEYTRLRFSEIEQYEKSLKDSIEELKTESHNGNANSHTIQRILDSIKNYSMLINHNIKQVEDHNRQAPQAQVVSQFPPNAPA